MRDIFELRDELFSCLDYKNLSNLQQELTEYMMFIIDIKLNKYKSIDEDVKKYVKSKYAKDIIVFTRNKNSSHACCDGKNIFYNLNFIDNMKNLVNKELQNNEFVKRYSIKKDQPLVSRGEYIFSEKDYLDILDYYLINRKTYKEICTEVLAHEVGHLLARGLGGILGEGFNELYTRRDAQEYNFQIVPALHSKETKIARIIENIVGRKVCEECFYDLGYFYLRNRFDILCGTGKFDEMYSSMSQEFEIFFRKNTSKDNLKSGFSAYREIDLSRTEKILNISKTLIQEKIIEDRRAHTQRDFFSI